MTPHESKQLVRLAYAAVNSLQWATLWLFVIACACMARTCS